MVRTTTNQNRQSRTERGMFFPKEIFKPKFKIEIDYTDGTSEEITNYVEDFVIALRARDSLEYFNASLEDIDNHFYGKFKGGETLRFYLDYSNATYLMLTARLEKWTYTYQSTDGLKISEITGSAWPEFKDKTISIQFENVPVETAISRVIANYPDLTYTISEISSDTISANYQKMNGLEIVRDICTRFNLEFYITALGEVILIDPTSENSKITTDAITIQQNLMGIESWEVDTTTVVNRVSINGKQDNYVTYLRTENNEDSQGSLWIKSKDVFDSGITNVNELMERATAELSINSVPQTNGRMSTMGMRDARPGKRIYISAPPLIEDWYVIRSCSHNVGADGWTTSFSIDEISDYDLNKVLLERKKQERELRPNTLDKIYDDCIVFDWKELSDYNFNKTEIVSGKLNLMTSETSGTVNLNSSVPSLSTDANTRSCFVKLNGTNTENCSVVVSNNDGLNSITFTGSELNSSEKDFAVLKSTHTVTVNVAEGINGSLSRPIIDNIGIYLLHD